jgi:hypothetical protein
VAASTESGPGKEAVTIASLPDPDGETYEDESFDTLIEVSHPALYPTDPAKITVHVDGADTAWSAVEIRWFAALAPQLLELLAEQSS